MYAVSFLFLEADFFRKDSISSILGLEILNQVDGCCTRRTHSRTGYFPMVINYKYNIDTEKVVP